MEYLFGTVRSCPKVISYWKPSIVGLARTNFTWLSDTSRRTGAMVPLTAMSPLQFPSTTDIVFVDTLHSSATIGPDCWGRIRAQPINVSIYLHLEQSYLDISGQTDNVLDTVNYGRLTKVISTLLDTPRSEDDPYSIDSLILAIGKQAFELSDADGVEEVRIVLGIPKMILLAVNFSIEATVSRMDPSVLTSKRVLVHDLVVPVVIGVNGHERRERQRVVVNIIFYEGVGPKSPVDYQKLIRDLFKVR